ncbi:MAG: hypothetical protein JWP35_3501 [Caulobacter sp.]|nr:hypothetical protein [Caulobacter sp.]
MRLIVLLPLILLAACGKPSAAPAPAASPAPATAAMRDAGPTFDLSADAAWARFQADFPTLAAAELVTDATDASCSVRGIDRLTVKVCAIGGKVDRVIVSGRPQSRPGDLDAAITTLSALFAPKAEAADLKRVKGDAHTAIAAGRLATICPYTVCFKVMAEPAPWMLAVSVGDN